MYNGTYTIDTPHAYTETDNHLYIREAIMSKNTNMDTELVLSVQQVNTKGPYPHATGCSAPAL